MSKWKLKSLINIFSKIYPTPYLSTCAKARTVQGRIQDFKLGGALKKIAPSGGRREKFWGISCEKSRFYPKKSAPAVNGHAYVCSDSVFFVYTLYNRFWLLMPHCRTRPLFFNKKTVFSTEREMMRYSLVISYLI
jgi:hypothetical protein